mmetsp:Transcript_48550/g.121540  ORF Transcript_48550/g.121540 Transcript_48550/m.121540 type:complete len:101 (-) Transcript_48550:319-621(-)
MSSSDTDRSAATEDLSASIMKNQCAHLAESSVVSVLIHPTRGWQSEKRHSIHSHTHDTRTSGRANNQDYLLSEKTSVCRHRRDDTQGDKIYARWQGGRHD